MFVHRPISQAVSALLQRPVRRPVILAACAALAASPAFAQLVANKSAIGTNQPLTVDLTVSEARSDSLYVAALVDDQHLFFFDEQGAAVRYQPGQVTPRRFAYAPQPGKRTVFSGVVPPGITGKVVFYSAFGSHGGDLIAGSALDPATVHKVEVRVGPALAGGRVAGRVVDAAAAGAQVCLDSNRNRRCDADEPSASADADGFFSFTADASLAAMRPVLAQLGDGNLLEAPVGNFAVVSALTTMVKHEQDVDPGVSLDRAFRNVSYMFNLPESVLLSDFSAAGDTLSQDAAAVAATLSAVLAREARNIGLAGERDARMRAARTLYVRNMLSGGAPGNPRTYPGLMIREANKQHGNDAARAATQVTFPADPERDAKISMLSQQKFDDDVTIADVRLEYLGNRFVALSYDKTKKTLTFGISEVKDGKIMKIDPTQVSVAQVVAEGPGHVPLATHAASYSIQPDGWVRVVGKNGGASSEILSTASVIDLAGKTIPLSELLAWSRSTSEIPAEYNIPVTFQAGDKLWREHHDKVSAPLIRTALSTLESNVPSMQKYIADHGDLFSPVMTVGDYSVFFRPSASDPGTGELVGYNKSTQTEVVVGSYYPRTELDGKEYIVLSAKLLKTYRVLHHDNASSTIKSASWRDFVMTCICWQRKFNLSAAQRIIDALKAVDSPLIKATTGTAPVGHAQPKTIIPISVSTGDLGDFDPRLACGGCASGGNCGACPVGLVLGLR